jgi:hypothetical protein
VSTRRPRNVYLRSLLGFAIILAVALVLLHWGS